MSEFEERRNNGNSLDLVVFRLTKVEGVVDTLNEKVSGIQVILATLKTEMEHVAKSEGKLSGAVYGIGSGVLLAIISTMVQMVLIK